MPPRPSLGLVIPTKPLDEPAAPLHAAAAPAAAQGKGVRDSWEVRPSGEVAMLGRSLRGDYVFTQDGLIRAAGQDAPAHKVAECDIMLIKPLGAGACATVHKGFHMGLRRFVAVKRVRLEAKEQRQQMLRDIKILSDAHQVPGLLSFLGAFLVPGKEQMAVVLEYMDGGTLADVLAKLGKLPEDVMAAITGKLLQGLAFMHAKHMVHRDIKPANILCSLAGEAKLSDFGISATVDHTQQLCNTHVGTVTYMSPERLESKPYSASADIWSLGLVLVECLTGCYPYDATAAPLVLIMHVLQDEPPLPPPGSVSELCRDFLGLCLHKDPARRPPATVLLGHPWVSQAAAVDLKGLLRRAMFSADDKLDEIAFHFSSTFYALLTPGGLPQLASLYLAHSVLSHQGQVCQGQPAILAKLQELAGRSSGSSPAWRLSSADCQPLLKTGCVVVHVMGSVQPGAPGSSSSSSTGAGSEGSAFSEAFILGRTPAGEYYVANQTFRLL